MNEVEERIPSERKPLSIQGRFSRQLDTLAVWWCYHFHPQPMFLVEDLSYYTCPTCGRKYATPWADLSKLDREIHYQVKQEYGNPERMRQAR